MKTEKEEFDLSLKLLAKSSFVIFIAVILSKAFTYMYRIVTARFYGPEAYGLLSLSLMIIGWFTIVAGMGLPNGLTRFVSFFRGKKQYDKISMIFRKSFYLLAFFSLVASILLFFLSEFIAGNIFNNSDLVIFLKIFSLVIPFVVLSSSMLAVMRAFELVNSHSLISKILDSGTKLILVVFLALYGLSQIAISLSYLGGAIITFLASLLYLKLKVPFVFTSQDERKSKESGLGEMFSYSWPLIFFGFAITLLHWTDTFIIGLFKTVKDVGFYNAAIPIALALTISIDLFRHLFFPLVTKEYSKKNYFVVSQLSKQVGKWVFMLSFPFFVLIMLFPGSFISLFFGNEYLVAKEALRFLAVGAMFTSLFEISKELLSMKGKTKLILVDIGVITFFNLLLNIALVPKYGINGAAFSTMLSLMALGLIFAFQAKKELGIFPVKTQMLKIAAISVLSGAALFLIKEFLQGGYATTIILLLLYFSLYLAGILITKCLDENDKLILNSFKRKVLKFKGKVN